MWETMFNNRQNINLGLPVETEAHEAQLNIYLLFYIELL